MKVGLSSFCHISEYATDKPSDGGVDGYENLHRMIAVSSPLNLWSPSSFFIRRPSCRVSPGDFVRLVEDGYIRIFGRESWIYKSSYRQSLAERWVGASWDAEIDDAIFAIHLSEERAQVSESLRKVVVAPPARGYEAAIELLADQPEWIDILYSAFTNPADRKIPIGTRETVIRDLKSLRHGTLPVQVAAARTILRDAQNHADAMSLAGAQAPFLLSADDTDFLNFLGQLQAPLVYAPDEEEHDGRGAERQARLGALTRQLIELIADMDALRERRHLREDQRITAWVGSEGHHLVMAWLSDLCWAIGTTDDTSDVGLVRSLADAISDSRPMRRSGSRRWVFDSRATTVDAIEELSILALGSDAPFNISDVGVEDLPRGAGLPDRLGWIRPEYSGPQWPYLYVFADRATRRRRRDLLRRLQSR